MVYFNPYNLTLEHYQYKAYLNAIKNWITYCPLEDGEDHEMVQFNRYLDEIQRKVDISKPANFNLTPISNEGIIMNNNVQRREWISAKEAFIAEVQFALNILLYDIGISRAELATRMGTTENEVDAFFTDEGANTTVGWFARAVHVLNHEIKITLRKVSNKSS
jgi:hypothetical protein